MNLFSFNNLIIRFEKRKGVLRTKNSSEILQIQNRIKNADEIFRQDIKKATDEFTKEKVNDYHIFFLSLINIIISFFQI